MATRESVLGSRELSGMIKTFADNSRNSVCTGIYRGGRAIVSDDPKHVEWDERVFSERLAPVVGFTEAPPVGVLPSEKNKVARMAKIAEVVSIPADRLFYDRELGELKPNAKSVVADAVQDLLGKINRSVELLCALALLDNMVVNSTVIPGSKQAFTISWGNLTRAVADLGDWSVETTKIVTEGIKPLVDYYRQNAGMLPSEILLNSATEGYLLKNEEVKELLQNPAYAANVFKSDHRDTAVLNGLGLGNMEWRKHLGGYKADGSTWTDFIPDDKVVVLPNEAARRDVLAMAEGYNLVPARLWGSPDDAASQIMRAPTVGISAYSEAKTRPMRVEIVGEWIGLPINLFPAGILVGTVA